MAKRNFKRKKPRYSREETRSYWVGYGIALERMKTSTPGYGTEGQIHMNTGWIPSMQSAGKGYDAAFKHKDNRHRLSEPFYPKEK